MVIQRADLLRPAEQLASKKDEVDRQYRKMSEDDFFIFAQGLIIDSQHGPRLFFPIMADFQRRCFEDMAPSLLALKRGEMPPKRRFWIERTKKASKDADLAVVIAWLIGFCERPFFGQVGAADRDQAAIVKDRLSALLQYNPWLNKRIVIVGNAIRSTAKREDGSPLGRIDIRSSEVAGAHGGTPDILLLNELSHITKWEFAENMMDNADGVSQGIAICATNAGIKGSDSWAWRQNALKNDTWSVHVLERPAPWHDRKSVKDAERRNPRSRYLRLWQGIWVSGRGDAVTEEDLDRVFVMEGPDFEPEPGWNYVAGLDIGVKKDHSGLVILGANMDEEKIRVARFRNWKPADYESNEIDLTEVEDTTKRFCELYNVRKLWYDPSQALFMAQRLEKTGIPCSEMVFSPSNLVKMAESFIQSTKEGRLKAYDTEDMALRTDLGKLNIVEKSYGYRLEAVSDTTGHADVATALLIALPDAVRLMFGSYVPDMEDAVATDIDDSDLTEEELDDMPNELRELYMMDSEDNDE